MRANCVQLATDAGRGGPGRPWADAVSSGTWLHRPRLHCLRTRCCITALVADTVKGGELNYMALALICEQTAYSSLLMLEGAVLADPGPMLSRLVRGCIALAFTACVNAVASSHRFADTAKAREAALLHDTSNGTRANCVLFATDTGSGACPGRP